MIARLETDNPAGFRERNGIWTLALANGISRVGNSMTSLAVPWFVLVTTDSASRTGLVGAVVAFSPVAAGLISGPIVDRLGFRKTSIISDALSGVTVALIPALYLIEWLTYWQLLVLVFLGAFFDVPGRAARRALVPSLARRSAMPLERANAALQLSSSLSDTIIAPLLAGFLIAAIGAAQVLFVDAGTFGVSILIIGLLITVQASKSASTEGAVPEEEGAGTAERLLAGFRFVFRDRAVMAILPMALLINFTGSAIGGVLLPVYVRDEYGNPAYFGLIIGAMGIGVLLGTLLYGAVGNRYSRYNTFLLGFSVTTVGIWLFTLANFLPTDLAGMFLLGLGMAPANPLMQTLLQMRTPERILGRVISALFTLFSVASPLGVLIAGVGVDVVGLRTCLIVTALLFTAVPFWLGFSPWSRAAAPAFDE